MEITGYGFINDRYFESRKVETKNQFFEFVFLEVIIKGLVSLYDFESNYYVEKTDSHLIKLTNEKNEAIVDRTKVIRESKRYIGILDWLLSDCIEIKTKIPYTILSERSLSKLIEDYNNCMNSPAVIYKSRKPWIQSKIGITGGINLSSLTFERQNAFFDHLVGSFEKSNSPLMGFSLDLSSPRLNERASFHSDFLYLQTKYYLFNLYNYVNTIKRNYVTFELKQLKIPFGIRYSFPERNLTPYINIGSSFIFLLNPKSKWIQEIELNNIVETYQYEAIDLVKYQVGIWGGAGIMKSISNKLNGFIEIKYEATSGINRGPYTVPTDIKSHVTNIQLSIGIITK